jgi:Flp pilus assembly protein TadD
VQVEQTGLPAARHAASLAPNDPLTLDTLGWTLTLLEQPGEALYHLARALSLEPSLASAHLHYGIAALQANDRTTAYQHLLQARDLDADGPVGQQAQALLNQYFP